MKTDQIVTIMDYNELEKLVINNLLDGIDLGKLEGENKYNEFSIVALEEWNNYEDHYCPDISREEFDGDFFQKHTLPEIKKFISERNYKPFQFSCNDLLVYLCNLNIITEGNYLIEVSW